MRRCSREGVSVSSAMEFACDPLAVRADLAGAWALLQLEWAEVTRWPPEVVYHGRVIAHLRERVALP